MKSILVFFLLSITTTLSAQKFVYPIKADSTRLYGCDSNELIIENHTQNVPGFLFNTGNGRTVFKRPLTKLSDTVYLVGADTLKVANPKAWLQGGNSFGTTGVLGTKDNNHLDLYTDNQRRVRLDSAGNFLIGYNTATWPYRLDVAGNARCWGINTTTVNDGYDIRAMPGYVYPNSVGGSMICFGNIWASIGVNKQQLGSIPPGSLIMGGTSPFRIATLVDYNYDPIFVADGAGMATINGGYSGQGPGGGAGISTNSNSPVFNINGGRGTGTGVTGDIVFSTGTAQASGTTTHAMTNRWWLKGGTGYLSNTSAPTSAVDVSGTSGYSQFRMRTTYTPASSTDTNGNTGDFSWDANYIYVKTPGGWKRATLATF